MHTNVDIVKLINYNNSLDHRNFEHWHRSECSIISSSLARTRCCVLFAVRENPSPLTPQKRKNKKQKQTNKQTKHKKKKKINKYKQTKTTKQIEACLRLRKFVFTPCEFFTAVLADGLSLKFDWQSVSSNLQDSSQYSGPS